MAWKILWVRQFCACFPLTRLLRLSKVRIDVFIPGGLLCQAKFIETSTFQIFFVWYIERYCSLKLTNLPLKQPIYKYKFFSATWNIPACSLRYSKNIEVSILLYLCITNISNVDLQVCNLKFNVKSKPYYRKKFTWTDWIACFSSFPSLFI